MAAQLVIQTVITFFSFFQQKFFSLWYRTQKSLPGLNSTFKLRATGGNWRSAGG